MTKQELFNLLLEQFLLLNSNRDRLIEAATTGEEAAQILAAWRQANLNQLDMGNKILINNTDEVRRIAEELKDVQGRVKESLQTLQQTANVLGQATMAIGLIGKAVSLGTQLVALA